MPEQSPCITHQDADSTPFTSSYGTQLLRRLHLHGFWKNQDLHRCTNCAKLRSALDMSPSPPNNGDRQIPSHSTFQTSDCSSVRFQGPVLRSRLKKFQLHKAQILPHYGKLEYEGSPEHMLRQKSSEIFSWRQPSPRQSLGRL